MKIINNFSSASSNFECIDRILLMSEFIVFIQFSPSNIVQFDVISVMYQFQLSRLTLKHSKCIDCRELKRKMIINEAPLVWTELLFGNRRQTLTMVPASFDGVSREDSYIFA